MRRWPSSLPSLLMRASIPSQEDTVMARIAPDHIPPEQARRAALRVWAAQVRDRQGPHASISPPLAEGAGTLAHVLDLIEGAQRTGAADNLVSSLQHTAAILIGQLLLG